MKNFLGSNISAIGMTWDFRLHPIDNKVKFCGHGEKLATKTNTRITLSRWLGLDKNQEKKLFMSNQRNSDDSKRHGNVYQNKSTANKH